MVTWQLLTGHDLDGPTNGWPRCVVVRMFGLTVPLCIRCSVLYPVALLTLVALMTGRAVIAPAWLLWTLPAPAWSEAVWEWTHPDEPAGRPLLRALVTLPLGLALGQLLMREFKSPADPLFWAVILAFGGTAMLVALAASLDKHSSLG